MAKKNRTENTLTTKQRRYVDCYDGNARTSAIAAGISYIYAKELHTKACYSHVQRAIVARNDTQGMSDIDTRQDRQRFWTSVRRDESQAMVNRLRASELLGKSQADFIDVVKGENTMRLQLGAPRALLEGQTTVDAEFEPVRLERGTEVYHETA
jgi:hypothetical protein